MAIHKMNDGCVERALNEIRYTDLIKKEAVYTGYEDLDRLLGGMLPGELYLIGSRPGMGKSIFTYNLLRHICIENGTSATLFSPDASAESVIQVMLNMTSNRKCNFFKTRERTLKDMETYEEAAKSIEKCPLVIEDSLNLTSEGIITRCREIKKETPIRIVFLDSWKGNHFSSKMNDKTNEDDIIESFRQIKSLAHDLELTFVINMHLSQEIESRRDHYPESYDFMLPAEAMDEVAGVMALHREAYYGSVFVDETDELKELLEIRIFRSRRSNFGFTNLLYRPESFRIDDYHGEQLTELTPISCGEKL